MVSKIEIKENEVSLYKQDTFIQPGTYFRFLGYRPSQKMKKKLGLKACQKGRQFMWLAPFEKWVKRFVDGSLDIIPDLNEQVPDCLMPVDRKILRDWQQQALDECFNYLRAGMNYRKGWIAPLGAGKTLAGLCISQFFEPNKVAVAAARYLHETWRSEAELWGIPCPILVTYESVHKLPEDLECLIVDEALAYKNPDALRTERARQVGEKCEVVVGFTATGMAGGSYPDLRWLRVADTGCLPADIKCWQFAWGLDTELKEFGGNKAYETTEWDVDAITEFASPYVHTVDLKSIQDELPKKSVNYVECEPPLEYPTLKAGAATVRGVHKKLAQLLQCTDGFVYNDAEQPVRIRSPKIKAVKDYVDNLNEPVIIATAWTEAVNMLSEIFQDEWPAVLNGATKDPGAEIHRFKTGHTRVLIVNARFSKGMNLQKACRILLYLSPSSKPDDDEQLIGRIYRPGQTKAVQVIKFICRDTLDKRRFELVAQHRGRSEDFVEQLLLKEIENG